jgi:hypothetical protein
MDVDDGPIVRCRIAACREALSDGNEWSFSPTVRGRGREAEWRFEFPKLYRMSGLPVVKGLGKPGWQVAAQVRL